ncbi:hypothetical protein LB507_003935 [Fusarium sp. FIESC RH6]|nr:hypothetical protein LB507_003935 [Fusarium sp. FIESC RH6]
MFGNFSPMQGLSEAIYEAKPTVRLKNPDGTYKETQEGDVFEARGGKPEDLMDEERWLLTPVYFGGDWQQTHSDDSTPRGLRGLNPDLSSSDSDGSVSGQNIWSPARPWGGEESTSREVLSQHIAFKHVARACNAKEFNIETQSIFVGISAVDCTPMILAKAPKRSTDSQDGTYSIYCTGLGTRSSLTAGREIVWLENMLIPGNIAHLRFALLNQVADSESFLRVMKRESNLLRDGLNPTGIARFLPSSQDPSRQPLICRPMQPGRNYDTLHYKLRWPPMALLEFPTEMIEAVQKFLYKHPHDNVPLNTALAATIIFMDLANEGWLSEGFMAQGIIEGKAIRPPSIGQFVLYFPHMLRYVETKHLTAFIHPARFATTHYQKDGKYDKYIKIDSTIMDAEGMRVWCSQIRSRHPQVPSNYRFNLIPASMPGSRMIFPPDCTSAEPPTTSLFRICCLDDIQTLGLPTYHYSSMYNKVNGGKFRLIGGPEELFCKRNMSPTHRLEGDANVDYWRPETDTRILALTGRAKSFGPVFPDIASPYYVGNIDIIHSVESHFGNVAYYTQDHIYHDSLSGKVRNQLSARATELLRVIDHLKIPLGKVWECQETGCLTWDGKEGHLQDLKERGTLKRIAEGDEVEREPKRPRTSERKLSDTVKAKIEDQLGSVAAASRNWDALRVYLQGNELTIEGVRKSLSQVQWFITSMEKEFCPENATNGRGNLEEVIRLTFTAAGLEPKLALAACENRLAWQKSMLTQLNQSAQLGQTPQLDQSIQQTIEDIYELRSLKNGFRHALPYVRALSDSPLIQGQSALLKEIDALLGEETLRDEA